MENDKPGLWSFMNITPVPKSGDLSNTNNYRGFILNLYPGQDVQQDDIKSHSYSHQSKAPHQAEHGFRQGRTTVAQILTLRRIIEGVKANNLPAIITFIDFKKSV